jgi:hypothetical protein
MAKKRENEWLTVVAKRGLLLSVLLFSYQFPAYNSSVRWDIYNWIKGRKFRDKDSDEFAYELIERYAK